MLAIAIPHDHHFVYVQIGSHAANYQIFDFGVSRVQAPALESLQNLPKYPLFEERCTLPRSIVWVRQALLRDVDNIKKIGPHFGWQVRQEDVNVSGNFAQWLQERQCHKIETLCLNCLGITHTLPPQIGLMKGVRTLQLKGNQLRFLPFEIGTLPFLEELDVSDNPIISLPDLSHLPYLRKIIATNTGLAIPDWARGKLHFNTTSSQLPDIF